MCILGARMCTCTYACACVHVYAYEHTHAHEYMHAHMTMHNAFSYIFRDYRPFVILIG